MRAGIAIERRLAQDPSSVAVARGALAPLERAVDPNTFETVRLLVSELVTNSVRHAGAEGGGEIELSVLASRERIRVEVADSGPGFTALAPDEGTEESGWGLRLVETLSDHWGIERDERTRVWFELVDSGAFASAHRYP